MRNSTDFLDSFQLVVSGSYNNCTTMSDKLQENNKSMLIYGILIAVTVILTISKALLFFKVMVMASRNLHARMCHRLLRVPMKFFIDNRRGDILNRISKDLGAIDEHLPRMLIDSAQVG